MVFKDFRFQVFLRVFLLSGAIFLSVYLYLEPDQLFLSLFFVPIIILQIWELYRFVSQTNKKLSQFLESIRYSDFISGFSSGNNLGGGFKELNTSFNDILDAFRKARSEKEENWQYLNIVVEHVNVGVISFDQEGNVGLINATAKKLVGIDQLRNIEELIEENSRLYKALFDLPPGKSSLYKTIQDVQLSIHATEVRLGDIHYKLVALQNIQPELQKKELEAWQNLTKILRHEIMNSITPIASLTSTMKDILSEEVEQKGDAYQIQEETREDLEEGLITIEDRSKGLINFINAYRDYTTIPAPNVQPIVPGELIQRVLHLLRSDIEAAGIEVTVDLVSEVLLNGDEDQIEQVLINIIKNSIEALHSIEHPRIEIKAGSNDEFPFISIEDNGMGIIREALEKIFIPFYTTKDTGSGIGLALSRQIMQNHHGTLLAESEPEVFTRFTLQF